MYDKITRIISGNTILTGSVQVIVADRSTNNVFVPVAQTISIVSNNAGDSLTGIGARKIEVTGLGSNYEEITEVVSLNGTIPVLTKKLFLRVYFAEVVTTGQTGFNFNNLGIITLTPSIVGIEILRISAGEGNSRSTQYTIPAGYYARLLSVFVASGIGKGIRIRFKKRMVGDNMPTLTLYTYAMNEDTLSEMYCDIFFSEKTDLWVTAENILPATTDIIVRYTLELRQDLRK